MLDLFCSLVLEVRNVDNSCNRTVKFLHISDKYNTLRQKKTGSIKHERSIVGRRSYFYNFEYSSTGKSEFLTKEKLCSLFYQIAKLSGEQNNSKFCIFSCNEPTQPEDFISNGACNLSVEFYIGIIWISPKKPRLNVWNWQNYFPFFSMILNLSKPWVASLNILIIDIHRGQRPGLPWLPVHLNVATWNSFT